MIHSYTPGFRGNNYNTLSLNSSVFEGVYMHIGYRAVAFLSLRVLPVLNRAPVSTEHPMWILSICQHWSHIVQSQHKTLSLCMVPPELILKYTLCEFIVNWMYFTLYPASYYSCCFSVFKMYYKTAWTLFFFKKQGLAPTFLGKIFLVETWISPVPAHGSFRWDRMQA